MRGNQSNANNSNEDFVISGVFEKLRVRKWGETLTHGMAIRYSIGNPRESDTVDCIYSWMADGYWTIGILANVWIWSWAYDSFSEYWEGTWFHGWWCSGGSPPRPILLLLDGSFLGFCRELMCLHGLGSIQIVRKANAIFLTPNTPPLVRSLAKIILTLITLAQLEGFWALFSVPRIFGLFPRTQYESKYFGAESLEE